MDAGEIMITKKRSRPLVAHVIDALPPDGAERLLVDVLKYRSSDFDYIVLCLVKGGLLEEELAEIGVPVMIFGKKRKFDLHLLFRLYKWFRKERPSVVHTHLFTADSWARTAAIMARVPGIFCTTHSANDWKPKVYIIIDRILARFSSRIIACSESIGTVLEKEHGIAGKRIVTISNGIDINRFRNITPVDLSSTFSIDDRVVKMLIIGRLQPVKGHLDLLPVLAKLKNEGLKFHLLIIGSGRLRDKIEGMVQELHLENCVTLAGFRKDVPGILASSDVVLMPSLWEGLPLSLLEAMVMGNAVVASAVGGIPDVIDDGENGFLFNPGDSDAMAEKIKKLIVDKHLRKLMGARAKKLVEARYSAKTVCYEYEALYRTELGL